MTQEAKIVALEHLVAQLVNQIHKLGGARSENIYEAAIASVMNSEYIDDQELKYAAKGALEDMATVIR